MIFKRGNVYWFDFTYKGVRHQESTHFKNAVQATNFEAAFRTKLINEGVDLKPKEEQKPVPTFAEFREVFIAWVNDKKTNEGTRGFYATNYQKLCNFKPLAKARLDQIDENMIGDYRASVTGVGRTTINHYLRTLRKALRYACLTKKLITRVPNFKDLFYTKEEGAERECDYVYTPAEYQAWLDAAPFPLREASILAHDCGICRGEMLALQKDCVQLWDNVDERGFWGRIEVKRGLKRAARKRTLPVTQDMAIALRKLLATSQCEFVFTAQLDHSIPLPPQTFDHQHATVMRSCQFHPDAGLHALRHSFLTAAGRRTKNVKALMKLAGHSKIETTMRYIHPDEEDVLDIAAAVNGNPGSQHVTNFTTVRSTVERRDSKVQ